MTEARLIAWLVGLIVIIGAVFFGLRYTYDAGHTAGIAVTTASWDADKLAIQRTADAALAQANAEKDMAVKANEAIENDYQAKLAASNATAADFSRRLSNALANLAANRNTASKASNNPITAVAVTAASADQFGQLVTLVTGLRTECKANSDQLDSLIAEVTPKP